MIEGGENLVEPAHEHLGRDAGGQFAEADEIAEQYGDLGKAVGDVLLALLEALGNGLGQNIQQQAVGNVPLGPQPGQEGRLLVAQPLFGQRGLDARHQQGRIERLGQEIVGPQRDAPHDGINLVGRGEHDHRDVAGEGVILEALEHFDSVQARHQNIKQDQVHRLGGDQVQGALATVHRLH